MKARPRHSLAFDTLRLEGALFLPDQLEKAALGAADFQSEPDYRTPKGLKLKDDISRAFQIASAQWKHFAGQCERADVDAAALTRNFVRELLRDAFGYTDIVPVGSLSIGDHRCRQRLNKNQQELDEETQRLANERTERTEAMQQLAIARRRDDRLQDRLRRLEAAHTSRESAWYSAKRLADDVERLAGLMDQQQAAERTLRDCAAHVEQKRDRMGAFLDQQMRVIAHLSQKFDPIIRRLVGQDADGTVTLNGNGLNLTVQMGGNRSTSAIDSLKVIAFDLAALCLSIEGATRVPAFLVHDSPREADLGLPLYDQVFQLAHWLEGVGGNPLFQYVVTTTTRPPPDLAKPPWLRLTLRGAPAPERLMKCDL